MRPSTLLASIVTVIVLVAALALPAGVASGEDGASGAVAGPRQADPTFRTVFFAVLEGLYDDGASNEFVDLVLREDPESGGAMHFVGGCPLCAPSLAAFRVYRARAPLGGKGGDTFGAGVDEALVAGMRSDDMDRRLDVVETLVARYVARRLASLRLTEAEMAEWRVRMAEGRKRGEGFLRAMQGQKRAGAFTDQDRCGACDGANGALDALK